MNELYKRTLYTIKAKWLIHEIFEYDIAKANISILLQYGYISPDDFNMYSQMNKLQRQIAIGRLQQKPIYSAAISRGFEEARKNLIVSNSIKEEDIVSIKKDAVYTLNRLNVTDFGNIHFTLRNTYSMFLNCMGLEIYFYWDERTDEYNIEIKGISDDKLFLHEMFITIIGDVLREVQKGNIKSAMQMMTSIREKYDSNQLPIECYREFNVSSVYRICGMGYGVSMLSQSDIDSINEYIDRSYNKLFLLELHKILMEIMFTR